MLVLRKEERMGKLAFDFVIVVDWDIHENAAVEADSSTLFGLVRRSAQVISVGQ